MTETLHIDDISPGSLHRCKEPLKAPVHPARLRAAVPVEPPAGGDPAGTVDSQGHLSLACGAVSYEGQRSAVGCPSFGAGDHVSKYVDRSGSGPQTWARISLTGDLERRGTR
jgi:hypothetical protein